MGEKVSSTHDTSQPDNLEQSRRFIEMARELSVEDKPDVFDATFMAVAHYKAKLPTPQNPSESGYESKQHTARPCKNLK